MKNKFLNWLFSKSIVSECIKANKEVSNLSYFNKILMFLSFYIVLYVTSFIGLYLIFALILNIEVYSFNYYEVSQEILKNANWSISEYIWKGALFKSLFYTILLFIIAELIIPIVYYFFYLIHKLYENTKNRQ